MTVITWRGKSASLHEVSALYLNHHDFLYLKIIITILNLRERRSLWLLKSLTKLHSLHERSDKIV
jgi:hypothetical protein